MAEAEAEALRGAAGVAGPSGPIQGVAGRGRFSTESRRPHQINHVARIGVDIAKRWFQIHAVDRDGREVLNRKLPRDKVLERGASRGVGGDPRERADPGGSRGRAMADRRSLPLIFDEFRVVVAEQTLSRVLRAMGYRKLSARPRHHAQTEGARPVCKGFVGIGG